MQGAMRHLLFHRGEDHASISYIFLYICCAILWAVGLVLLVDIVICRLLYSAIIVLRRSLPLKVYLSWYLYLLGIASLVAGLTVEYYPNDSLGSHGVMRAVTASAIGFSAFTLIVLIAAEWTATADIPRALLSSRSGRVEWDTDLPADKAPTYMLPHSHPDSIRWLLGTTRTLVVAVVCLVLAVVHAVVVSYVADGLAVALVVFVLCHGVFIGFNVYLGYTRRTDVGFAVSHIVLLVMSVVHVVAAIVLLSSGNCASDMPSNCLFESSFTPRATGALLILLGALPPLALVWMTITAAPVSAPSIMSADSTMQAVPRKKSSRRLDTVQGLADESFPATPGQP